MTLRISPSFLFFFFNDTATTEIYPLSLTRRSSDLNDTVSGASASRYYQLRIQPLGQNVSALSLLTKVTLTSTDPTVTPQLLEDRKSTRLNSSHANISYAVFCLKKKIAIYQATDASP